MDAPGALPRKVLHALLTLGDTDRLAGAVLRWLLDAEAEHGLGATFQERLAAFLETCDATEVAFALQSGMFPVSADLVPRANSCDLLVALAGEPRLALVSATTALREPFAVEEYRSMEATVVVLERLGAEPPGVALPVWFWTAAAREVLPRIAAGPLRDFVAQLLAHDPQAPDAASSAVDLGAAKAQHPAPPPAPPELPGPGKGPAPGLGGGLSDRWLQADGGGGLSDGWLQADGGGGGGLSDGWLQGGSGLSDG